MDQILFPIFVMEGQQKFRVNVLCTYEGARTRRTGLASSLDSLEKLSSKGPGPLLMLTFSYCP